MNITEAHQLSTVLAWVLGRKARPERWGPLQSVSDLTAREAAAWLADRSSRALGAGVTPETVRDNWPSHPLSADGTLDTDARLIRAVADRMEISLGDDPQVNDAASLVRNLANAISDLGAVAEHIINAADIPALGETALDDCRHALEQIKDAAVAFDHLEGWL